MIERIVFATTDDELSHSMEQASHAGASALGAALWAYIVAVGTEPGVLFSPVALLLSGFGARRALDGRCRQPGLGLKRPRGFVSETEVPDAARVAASQALAAWFVAQTYDERSMRSLAFAAAKQRAKQSGSPERELLLDKISRHGPAALRQDSVRKELLGVAGPVAGGSLSVDDLAGALDVDRAAERDDEAWRLPWDGEISDFQGVYRGLVARDRRGTTAALVFGDAATGLDVPALGLRAPLLAQPVMRGVARPKVGAPLRFRPQISLLEGTEASPARVSISLGHEVLLQL